LHPLVCAALVEEIELLGEDKLVDVLVVKVGVLIAVLAGEERLLPGGALVDEVKLEKRVLEAELVEVVSKLSVELVVDVLLETIVENAVVVVEEEIVEPVVVVDVDEVIAVEFVQYGTAASNVSRKLANFASVVRSSR